ncbi:hypothetical protein CAPTEDRAFT_188858 [Capitella teleta]|uniref:Uncharacterized protein n=1 Tax=Capitella teleta TaxID=283909 RepID=R7TN90_CAPTE|nr:hypothetical protein CAPTEDRAFT_188858 [Capitella teleta]|eukprot:ELT95007.1 hypothetical protein CAPTEDRAFT_188858 [Capitella teleta]
MDCYTEVDCNHDLQMTSRQPKTVEFAIESHGGASETRAFLVDQGRYFCETKALLTLLPKLTDIFKIGLSLLTKAHRIDLNGLRNEQRPSFKNLCWWNWTFQTRFLFASPNRKKLKHMKGGEAVEGMKQVAELLVHVLAVSAAAWDFQLIRLRRVGCMLSQKAIHLGTVIGSGADQANIKKAISDLHVSTNMLASTFSHCSSDVLCSLFKTNCTSFYGSPLWNLDQTHTIQLHISWRKCIGKLFGLHPRTRSKYIPSLVRCSDLPVQLLSRFANFWYKCSFNANTLLSICAKLSLTSSSIAACNLKLLAAYLSCDASSLCMLGAPLSSFVQDQWKRSVRDGEAALASAVAELRDVVRGHSSPILSIAEARRLLLEVCLSEV